jgi:hypothetical protein
MDDIEQQFLARMSTFLQALDEFSFARFSSFNGLVAKAIADERYRRELAEAEAAKELTP